jgi:hypothetical protein
MSHLSSFAIPTLRSGGGFWFPGMNARYLTAFFAHTSNSRLKVDPPTLNEQALPCFIRGRSGCTLDFTRAQGGGNSLRFNGFGIEQRIGGLAVESVTETRTIR